MLQLNERYDQMRERLEKLLRGQVEPAHCED